MFIKLLFVDFFPTIYPHLLQGTQVYSVTSVGNVILAMDGSISNEYDVSGLSYYDTGFTFDDIIYAASGESLSLNLSYYNLPEGPGVAYSADHGTLSGDSNPYTLEMAASNTTISATILPLRSSNGNYYSWEYFAAHPRDCGETIYLECDITVTSMVSGQSWNTNTAFNKTFDGQNRTITLAIDTTINEAGLFRYTNNAFFQNLKLEGYIHSTSGNTASLIGLSQEFVSIVDCHSNVTVSNADDYPGKISGEKYLCFNAGDGYYYEDYANYSYAIMPAFANNEVPNHISFKYKFQAPDKGVLTFGVIDDTDISTYTVLGTVQGPINNPGTAVVDLDPEQTMGKRIAFRWYVYSYWYTCGIDDIGLNFEPEKQFTNRSGDGRWETANNWYPIGVPHFTNDVAILADVTIGAGVVAQANNITVGSNHTITIEDGGQK